MIGLSSSAQQAFSDFLGYSSIACWLGAQFPCVVTLAASIVPGLTTKIDRSSRISEVIHAKDSLCLFLPTG